MMSPVRSRQHLALAAVLCLVFLVPLPARADAPAVPRKVVTIEGITEYRLDNGLRVLLFPDPSTPRVVVNLTVLVGSRHEGYGETGMAHLLEHMVFKGTPTHRDIPRALKERGAQFNGTTWVDRTNYFETLPASDANLEFAIRLEADRLVNSLIRREDLASEMTVVRNEFEMGENNPQNILSQRMMAAAFEWHNYGKSTIGNRSDIERVPVENLRAFYRKYYQPDNAVLVIAGKFDEAKALEYVGKYFGVLKRPERRLENTYTEEPPQDGERQVVLRRVGKVGVVGVLYHIPAAAHEDFAAVEVLNQILVAEPAGRVYKALVPTKKANSVTGDAYGWHDPGVLELLVEVDRDSSLESVRDTLIDILEKLPQEPFTPEEVERAKRRLLKNRELLMTDSNRIGIVLSDWAAKGDWRLFFLHRDRLAKVTPEDVSRVARRYLVRSNRTVGLYIPSDRPERAEVPAAPPAAELVKDYKGGTEVAAGEYFDPTPANIEQRVRRSTLPGGLKLALLPRKTRGEAVVAQLTLRFGNEESLKGQTGAADALGPLMLRGTRQHTRQQIEDELDRLKARVQAFSGPGQVTFSIQGKRESLPAVLTLLKEVLREPSFPAEEFDILKREERDALAKQLTEPTTLAVVALRRKLNPYPPDDVRYTPTLEEAIARLEAVTVEQVRRLYTEQLGGEHGELAVVGDFDPATVTRLAGELVKDWKAKVPYRRIPRQAKTDVASERQTIHTPDKANAVYTAGLALALSDTDPDYPALEVGNFILGGGTLSSRLGNRVRQQEGLSYGVRSMFNASPLDKSAEFTIYAICNPANLEKVDKAVLEELEKLLKEGVEAKELEEAKKAYLEQLKVQHAIDSRLARQLGNGLFAGRTMAYYAELEKKVAALTPEQVNEAVRRHLTPKRLVIISAGDLKKQGTQE
ncbi:MAG TPA: pitrilysin family protein [Gemmataceae bacterium]|nr:pitrilysin family protein [Gemmataceae bacterium]